ncbi:MULTISPECIES: hypothetical protein [Micromonospora]|nr:hypothetical protein [Micromonospora sp. NBRC 110037]MDH6468880.1 hypothetical protein [Micromonospora sp. H404/HB375]
MSAVGRYLPWMWLGLRLTVRGGRRALVRTVLLGAGAAVGIVLVLGALAVPTVVDAQDLRVISRTPVTQPGADQGLRVLTIDDAVAGRLLRRVNVSGASGGAPVPPGVGQLPAAGEVVVSPALRELIAANPHARQRFPQRVVGTIGAAGLTAPDELIAYVGVDAARMPADAVPVVGFGDSDANRRLAVQRGTSDLERLLTPGRMVAFAFAFFLLAPLAVLLSTAAGLSASAREQRLAALRLLGASARQAQAVNAVETGVAATIGVALGYAAFPLLRAISADWSLGRFRWYATDVHVGAGRAATAGAIIAVFAVIVAVAGATPAVLRPVTTRRRTATPAPRAWRLLAFIASVMALLAAMWLGDTTMPALALLAAGMLGVALTLPLVLPALLTRLWAPLLRWTARPVWVTLAARRVLQAPNLASRLVGALMVALFIGGVGTIGTAAYQAANTARQVSDTGWLPQTILTGDQALADKLTPVVGTDNIAYYESLSGIATVAGQQQQVSVVRGSCASLAVLFDTTWTCTPGKAYRAKWSDQLPPGTTLRPADDGDAAVTAFTIPADTAPLNTSPFGQGTDIVVAETPRQGTIVAKVTADQGKLEDWYAVTAALAPTAVVQGYREIPTGFDAGAVIVLVTAGLLITAAMGFIAFAMSTVDRRIATRRANVPLAVIGAPRRTLTAADLTESVSGLILGQLITAAAVILTAGTAAAVLRTASFADLLHTIRPMLTLAAAGVVLGTLITILATTSAGRPTPALLRHE